MTAHSDSKLLLEQAKAELAQRSLAEFCARTDPQFVLARHTQAIVERLEALERRDIDKLILAVPPRFGKSYLTSERFPAWWIGRNPAETVVLASYGQELAERSSRRARSIVASDRWPFDTRLSGDTSAMNRWDVTGGGGLIAAGVGSALTGMGAHALIVDDPIKDRAEAESPTIRDATWTWFQDVARTRLMPRGVQLLIQTRWHEDDLAGRILNSRQAKNWETLILPAIAEDDDPLGRAEGEELWPERGIPLPSVELGEISARSWASLYQQNPTPLEGALFSAPWFERRYTSIPSGVRTIMAVDGAWKTGVSHDFSVIAVWAASATHFYLVDVWRQRVEFPALKTAVVNMFQQHRPREVIVEDAASGTAIIQSLRAESRLPIIGLPAKGSKEARAEAVTPLFEAGRILLPVHAPWLDAWIEEHLRFGSGAKHDDQVDTTSLALTRLSKRRSVFAAVISGDGSMWTSDDANSDDVMAGVHALDCAERGFIERNKQRVMQGKEPLERAAPGSTPLPIEPQPDIDIDELNEQRILDGQAPHEKAYPASQYGNASGIY